MTAHCVAPSADQVARGRARIDPCLIVPFTSSLAHGDVVQIPTFHHFCIRNLTLVLQPTQLLSFQIPKSFPIHHTHRHITQASLLSDPRASWVNQRDASPLSAAGDILIAPYELFHLTLSGDTGEVVQIPTLPFCSTVIRVL